MILNFNMWQQILYIILLMYLIPLFHELGHAIYLRERLKLNPIIKFKYGFPKRVEWIQTKELTPKQEQYIAFAGVLAGLIPFFFFESLHPIFFIPLVVIYSLISCKHDWKMIFNGGKNEKENNTL